MLTCPTCGLEVAPDSPRCPRDGTDLLAEHSTRPPVGPASGEHEAVEDPPPAAIEPTVIRYVPMYPDDARALQPQPAAPPPPAPPPTSPQPTSDSGEKKDPLVGAQLGEYVVQEQIGTGGMGVVYKALQPMIGKPVAIKLLRPEVAGDPEQVQRLLAEARAVNAIRHRGIIDIFGFGQLITGQQYMVMEYLEGSSLDRVIATRAPLPAIEVVGVLEEVLAALAAAHGAGVIHRDLKPNNIFIVTQPDGTKYTKLLDFGLAKQNNAPRGVSPQTRINQVVGTPEYMAPEQARGIGVGPQTDLYAMGIVAYEMLTGTIPFSATSPLETVMQHIEKVAPPPSSVERTVPPELSALVMRLLEKESAQRPASAEAVRQELIKLRRRLMDSATRIVPSGQHPVATRPAKTTPSFVRPERNRGAAELQAKLPVTAEQPTFAWRNWVIPAVGITALLGATAFWVARRPRALPARVPQLSAVEPRHEPAAVEAQAEEAAAAKAKVDADAEVAAKTKPPAQAEAAIPVKSSAPAEATATSRAEVEPKRRAEVRVAKAESKAPSRDALLARIDRLERTIGEDKLALAFLKKYRMRADAGSPADRKTISEQLDELERKFVKR